MLKKNEIEIVKLKIKKFKDQIFLNANIYITFKR